MPDINEISVSITVKTAEDHTEDHSPPTMDDRFRCDLWAMCDNPYCFEHGCINALRHRGKGVKQ